MNFIRELVMVEGYMTEVVVFGSYEFSVGGRLVLGLMSLAMHCRKVRMVGKVQERFVSLLLAIDGYLFGR